MLTAPSKLLKIDRLREHDERYYELKDPSIVKLANDSYMMFASVGNSIEQHWKVGRFVATDPFGIWTEIQPTRFHNLTGPQLCAPAVEYAVVNGQPIWTMYIQTACFEENGVIAVATSTDGLNFYGQPQIVASRNSIETPKVPIIGVYDVGTSEINYQGADYHCVLFSAYRRVGCGDLYLSVKKAGETDWTKGMCILEQEEVPFHNHPEYEHFEWGLEGAKIIQLAEDSFALIGVCFTPKPDGFLGTRQRVFFATSRTPFGPYTPVGTPIEPQRNQWNTGENGHPDTLLLTDQLVVIYQERGGDAYPWHLRITAYDISQFSSWMATTTVRSGAQESASGRGSAQSPLMTVDVQSADTTSQSGQSPRHQN